MKKRVIGILIIVFICILAFVLVGCDDLTGKEKTGNDQNGNKTDNTVIVDPDGDNADPADGDPAISDPDGDADPEEDEGKEEIIAKINLLQEENSNYTFSLSGTYFKDVIGPKGFYNLKYTEDAHYLHCTAVGEGSKLYEYEIFGTKTEDTYLYYIRFEKKGKKLDKVAWVNNSDMAAAFERMRLAVISFDVEGIEKVDDHYEYTDPETGTKAAITLEENALKLTLSSGKLKGEVTLSDIGTTIVYAPDDLPKDDDTTPGENLDVISTIEDSGVDPTPGTNPSGSQEPKPEPSNGQNSEQQSSGGQNSGSQGYTLSTLDQINREKTFTMKMTNPDGQIFGGESEYIVVSGTIYSGWYSSSSFDDYNVSAFFQSDNYVKDGDHYRYTGASMDVMFIRDFPTTIESLYIYTDSIVINALPTVYGNPTKVVCVFTRIGTTTVDTSDGSEQNSEPQSNGGQNSGSQGYTLSTLDRINSEQTCTMELNAPGFPENNRVYKVISGVRYYYSDEAAGWISGSKEAEGVIEFDFFNSSNYVVEEDHYRYTGEPFVEEDDVVIVESVYVYADSIVMNLKETIEMSTIRYSITFTDIGTATLDDPEALDNALVGFTA